MALVKTAMVEREKLENEEKARKQTNEKSKEAKEHPKERPSDAELQEKVKARRIAEKEAEDRRAAYSGNIQEAIVNRFAVEIRIHSLFSLCVSQNSLSIEPSATAFSLVTLCLPILLLISYVAVFGTLAFEPSRTGAGRSYER